VEKQKALFESHGGRAVFVELTASLEERLRRNESELRISSKPSKRHLEASRKRLLAADDAYRLDSKGDFPFPQYLRIDNTNVSPQAVAEQIIDHFALARGGGDGRRSSEG
jgi:hypothetical protein